MVTIKKSKKKHPLYIDLILFITLASLIIGLLAPIMTFKKLVFKNRFSIISGLMSLLEEGDYLLFLIIGTFSILFPLSKVLFLFILRFRTTFSGKQAQKYLHYLGVLSKWSMLDVFVVALLVMTVKLGFIGRVIPHWGIYMFAFAVLMSSLSAAIISRQKR